MTFIESTTGTRVSANFDDRAALTRIAAGDRAALKELYFEYHKRLLRFALRLTHDAGLAEEIVNDTMITVWQHAGDFRDESRVSTWIMGIVYRRSLKAFGAKQRQLPTASAAAVDPDAANQVASLEALAHDAEVRDWVEAALKQLTPEHRLVVELAYFVGLSCEEIATVTACPTGTVKTRLHYARLRMRAYLVSLNVEQQQ